MKTAHYGNDDITCKYNDNIHTNKTLGCNKGSRHVD